MTSKRGSRSWQADELTEVRLAPTSEGRPGLEVRRRQTKPQVQGLTTVMAYELMADEETPDVPEVCLTRIWYEIDEPLPAVTTGAAALRHLGYGDLVPNIVDAIEHVGSLEYEEWVPALERHKSHPGRGGSRASHHLTVARHRIEAEEQQPGNAIRYMVRTWPAEYPTPNAAHQRVRRARAAKILRQPDDGIGLTDEGQRLLSQRTD